MTVMLKDAPGGAALIESLTEAIKDLSLLYAGTPDERAKASLKSYVAGIESELIAGVGAGPAKIMLEAFAAAVMGEKHRVESDGTSRA